MPIHEDRRPTLASWPKRIFDWDELPAPFRPALADWQARGLPPGNVTYIPRVGQYRDGPEYATAWLGREVLLQRLQGGSITPFLLGPGGAADVTYQVQLLRCTVTIRPKDGGAPASFSYNKTKEDQLLPILNLLLGAAPEAPPVLAHPAGADPAWLREESYAMYHMSLLCYRFGETLCENLFLRGRCRSPLRLLQRMPDPEYFLAVTARGLVVLQTDFYGTRADYLTSEGGLGWAVEPPAGRRGGGLMISSAQDPLRIPLVPGQEEAAADFLRRAASALSVSACAEKSESK